MGAAPLFAYYVSKIKLSYWQVWQNESYNGIIIYYVIPALIEQKKQSVNILTLIHLLLGNFFLQID
jgi:hypothetical protein